MIKHIPHPTPVVPTGVSLALDVTHELTAPRPPARPADVAAPQLMGLRMPAERPHRHKVPLRRLTAMCV
ncbi:hypothetical protein [Streptomyces brasiliensis]|uniref:Uncharacterized protein n=1 Tax=Streptomyces brasiliensis TaxID=1954 RepID=A0A917L514_9ACTN|nr:hypothetical protein [Streptomyces brasiliensis]GGJ44817.1 hypothetical protein GCM10010121_065020 [Streptomyces brasiliensis]